MPADLRTIRDLEHLLLYLENELEWPIKGYDKDNVTFTYEPSELGIKDEDAAKIKAIYQLRPLHTGQPWGIFYIEFEKKKLPVVVLRRILSHLVIKKRASASQAESKRWNPADLLFISAFGDDTGKAAPREIAFAHFHSEPGDLPTLRVLGWDGDDTPLKIDHVSTTLKNRLRWPDDAADAKAWRTQWSGAFRHRIGHVIRTADTLAQELARLARGIRDSAKTMLKSESENGLLTKLYKAFKAALINDLTPESFADTYAQTITYGLLTAAISKTDISTEGGGTALIAENITDMVPVTNPFLKEMLDHFLKIGGRKGGIDFDELGVQDVVELLRGGETDLPEILRDFGNKTQGEDPVIHFYEHFLEAYNKELKIKRGVFYTPKPVVSYIVRSVHELLQTEFGLDDGLADITTWGEMVARTAKSAQPLKLPPLTDEHGETRTIPENEPFVQILDPATGTATFLVEVIDVIYHTLVEKWKKQKRNAAQQRAAWNDYVPKHLLPRLHAYELMMAPYAIAHMKIGLKLFETGYRFGTDERARIYLTNALEPKVKQLPAIGFDALAHEAAAVNEIKWYKRFTVVIGNPPYAGISGNMSEPAQQLVDRYRFVNGEPLGERKLWLQNDYVKFLGFAHLLILNTGVGCLGYITDNSYLDGPTFRGVRSNFLHDFTNLQVLNLHGGAKKMTTMVGAEVDQNVFDITQAVAIIHGIRLPSCDQCRFCTAHLVGSRESKYDRLSKQNAASVVWSGLTPTSPFYQFAEANRAGEAEYNGYYSIKAAFPLQSVGIQTSRDHLAVDFTRQELVAKIRSFSSPKVKDADIRERYFPGKKVGDYAAGDTRGWNLSAARKELLKVKNLDSEIVNIHYRPFDFRFVFNSTLLVDWPRPEVSEQMRPGKNLGLCVLRRTENTRDYDYFSVSRGTISNHQVSLKDGTYLLPLYFESAGNHEELFANQHDKRPNLSHDFLKAIATTLQLPQKGLHGLPADLTPEDIFHYIYAVFYSPGYRSRYAEFLKIDFPRLPLTENLELFRALARLGGELTALHLLESDKLDNPITKFVGNRNPEVEKLSWSHDTVWIDKAQATGFQGVPENVWNFHIGGYQVCEKWLKDRKGRRLSDDEIAHYHKIVIALSKTIRLMSEIDKAIDTHGGWPNAFQTPTNTQNS